MNTPKPKRVRDRRIVMDLNKDTYKALCALSDAMGKPKSTIARQFLTQARPQIIEITKALYRLKEKENPQQVLESFKQSVMADLEGTE
jgi:vacuolar-type H+-ATPase subunit F/Vma7